MNYYNENDPYAAQWLRNLVEAGRIPFGYVDQRSILEVAPSDLRSFVQCHFFAGIGGWPLTLALAGWPEDKPVWTGSCPCQPFSIAGKNKGTEDERHLWPILQNLITECQPATVFGEQVASPAGRGWLAGVRADLEALGYAVGAADLCAASVGAPHIRQRLFWVADAGCGVRRPGDSPRGSEGRDVLQPEIREESPVEFGERSSPGGVADAHSINDQCGQGERRSGVRAAETGKGPDDNASRRGASGGMVNPFQPRLEGLAGDGDNRHQPGRDNAQQDRPVAETGGVNFWSGAELIPCADGKVRRVEPGVSPLAHGVPGRVGKLRAYGNAIVPQIAAQFIKSFAETDHEINS